MIHCISPIFFGGSHPVQVVVSHQVSNIVDYEFPSLEVTSVDPLVVESIGATLFIHAEHIPPATRIPLTVSIGSVNTSNCHISLSSNFDEPFIECHLPELRRGRWPLALFVDSVAIPISQPFSILTVICGVNQYAAVGAFCTSCPENAVCPANATLPMAPAAPGQPTEQREYLRLWTGASTPTRVSETTSVDRDTIPTSVRSVRRDIRDTTYGRATSVLAVWVELGLSCCGSSCAHSCTQPLSVVTQPSSRGTR